jgi:ATP-binding cassette subfamily F protein uup
LVDLLAGRRKPTVGTVEVGPTVVVGYYDQLGTKLDLSARVQDLVAGPHRSPGSLADIDLMKRFLFTDELPFARVGTLSGGERRRLQLLLVIAARPNVLFLDEPTNDFDLDTLRILEDFLEDWPGALVVVSHDRTFLERTTDRVVTLDVGGAVVGVPGGVDGWIARLQSGDPRRVGSLPPPDSTRPTPPPNGRRGAANGKVAVGQLLRQTEKTITRLQRQRDKITEALAGAQDHVEMNRLGAELAAAQGALDEAEESWLALAEEAE